MKKSRFTEEQMIGALQRLDGGATAKDIARDLGVNVQTLYRWREKCVNPEYDHLRQLIEPASN